MKYEIREMRPGEAAELKSLASPNFSIVEGIFISKPKIAIIAQTDDGIIAGSAFLVIVESGGKKVGCIDIIFVNSKYRGTGVAKKLYHAAVENLHYRGCETVMALVKGDNSQSLCRFEDEGLYPVSLNMLRKQIGFSATIALFVKTASLACATGCWILCEKSKADSIGSSSKNILNMFFVNGALLLIGAIIASIFQGRSNPWWNLLAAIFFLAVITIGESIGRKIVGGDWSFVMPEGGLLPSAIVALSGGFYPMLGHWYLSNRENTDDYRRRMAAPIKGAWLLLMVSTLICGILNKMHPFFSCGLDLGIILIIFYMLPFYPFDTFGGRRLCEHNERTYAAFVTFSIITIAFMVCSVMILIKLLLEREIY